MCVFIDGSDCQLSMTTSILSDQNLVSLCACFHLCPVLPGFCSCFTTITFLTSEAFDCAQSLIIHVCVSVLFFFGLFYICDPGSLSVLTIENGSLKAELQTDRCQTAQRRSRRTNRGTELHRSGQTVNQYEKKKRKSKQPTITVGFI